MAIKVLFFGVLSEVCGTTETTITAKNLDELKESLFLTFVKLKDYKFAIAVNQQIVKENIVLNQNDEVALLPPYSGG